MKNKKKAVKKEKRAISVKPTYLKVSELIGGNPNTFNDGSGSWIEFVYGDMQVVMNFSGDGLTFQGFQVAKDVITKTGNVVLHTFENDNP